jgi:hypothetical protein
MLPEMINIWGGIMEARKRGRPRNIETISAADREAFENGGRMKNLIVFAMLLLMMSSAGAQDLGTPLAESATMENGKIVLYDTPCSIGGRSCLVYGPFGEIRWIGCWAQSGATWAESEYVIGLQDGMFPKYKWDKAAFRAVKQSEGKASGE